MHRVIYILAYAAAATAAISSPGNKLCNPFCNLAASFDNENCLLILYCICSLCALVEESYYIACYCNQT